VAERNCSHFPIVIEYLSKLELDCDNVSHVFKLQRNTTATYKLGYYVTKRLVKKFYFKLKNNSI